MTSPLRPFAAAALHLLATASPAEAGFVVRFETDPWTTMGPISRRHTDADGELWATEPGSQPHDVSFWFDPTNPDVGHVNVDLAPPGVELLQPILYEGVLEYPWDIAIAPTMRVTAGGEGCGVRDGRFRIYEISHGAGGELQHFAADFASRCGFGPGGYYGSIRFNASETLPELFDDDGDGRPEVADVCPGLADPDQHDSDLDGAGDACDPSLAATFLRIDDETGDYDWHLNASNAAFTDVTHTSGAITFSAYTDARPPGLPLRVVIEPPDGTLLTPGVYEILAPEDGDISVGGGSCDGGTKRVEVFEADYEPEGRVRTFSADFELICGFSSRTTGRLRYHAAFRAAANDTDGDGFLDSEDLCATAPDPTGWLATACPVRKAARRCVTRMNERGAALVRRQARSVRACLANAAAGRTDRLGVPADAQSCLANDVGGKRARAAARLTAADARFCADLDAFGYAAPQTIHDAALAESIGLAGDLFGPDLGSAISAAGAPHGARCQARALDAALDAVDALWKLTVAKKRTVLSGEGAVTSGAGLGQALEAHLRAELTGVVAATLAPLEQDPAATACWQTDFAAAFPGCGPFTQVYELRQCAERAARCRFCRTLNAFDELAVDCDAFDDDEADASCS
jgi:hypothetical protein